LPFQLSAVVVIWVVAAALLFRRRFPGVAAAFLAYLITLIPVLGIFHNGKQITADRYSYLACLGLALLAGACLLGFQKAGRTVVVAVATLIVCVLGFLSWRQVQVWRDSDTLWTHAIEVEPSFMAFNNLGLVFSARGDTVGAIERYHNSIQIFPDFEISHSNLGASLLDLEEWDDAVSEFHIALNLNPDLVNAHTGLGYALMKQGKLDEAIDQFQIALRIDPNYKPARTNLEYAQLLKRAASK
jgi:tetratricopeptide (TPR) repeat protein